MKSEDKESTDQFTIFEISEAESDTKIPPGEPLGAVM